MEDILKRVNYDRNAAKDAFTMLNLEDTFTLTFDIYQKFVENFIDKLEERSQKTSVKRLFNNSGMKMNRKIKSYLRGAAKSMGYLETKPDVFDRSLNQFRKSWEEILKKKKRGKATATHNSRGEKKDRCALIADQVYEEHGAYKSGAITRCRQGKIWVGRKA